MAKVISTGSVIVDLAIRIPQLPDRGGDVLGSDVTREPGGGFNILAAAARYGAGTFYGGIIGNGPNGQLVADALAQEGIGHHPAVDAGEDTGTCVTLVEPDGERTFVTATGAEAALTSELLDALPVEAGDAVAVSGYELAYPESGPVLADWVSRLPSGIIVSFDPGPLLESIPHERFAQVLGRCDILTLNQREAQLFASSPRDSGTALARRVLSAVPRDPDHHRALVIREGASGCVVTGGELGDAIEVVVAPRIEAVDTTGAGDAHAGVLLAAFLDGSGLVEAASIANRAAALTVTRCGPATSPTRAELDASVG
jgi:ribokinase